jgi:glycerophosphoryl diester phosphodiesterase
MRRALLVVLAVTIAAGCGGDDDAGVADETSPATTAVPTTRATTAPSIETDPPTTEGESTTSVPTTTVPGVAPGDSTTPTTTPPSTAAPDDVERPTVDELLASDHVLNIAHAGGDQAWPHSTFYAFDHAVAAGADVLEMDVQLTGDGVLIVQHDDTVDGTTNGTGRVDSFTFDEITQLDAAHWYIPGCWPCRDRPADDYALRGVRTGERPAPDGVDPETLRIVSFAEVAERYPDMPFDIEIKGDGAEGEAVARQLAAEIQQHGLTEHVVVVSFDDPTVEVFRGLAPGVAVSPGVVEMSAWLLAGEPLDPAYPVVQVPPRFGDVDVLTPDFWAAAADAGVDVWVWPDDWKTQENAEFYAELISQGVDGIIAGRPDLVDAARPPGNA